MVMHVLPETNQEGYGLLNATLLLEMDVGQFHANDSVGIVSLFSSREHFT